MAFVCLCWCKRGCWKQRSITAYSSSSLDPFVFLGSTILALLIWVSSFPLLFLGKSDSGFKSPPVLQTSIEPQVCFFVQHYWKRWWKNGLEIRWTMLNHAFQNKIQNKPFSSRGWQSPSGDLLFLGQCGQVKRIFCAWWNRWDAYGHWHAIIPLPHPHWYGLDLHNTKHAWA